MRSGIKAIAALVLLSGCGSDANGADNQTSIAQNATATHSGAVTDPYIPTMNLAPLPPGYVRLNAEEVKRLIKGKILSTPFRSWWFDVSEPGKVTLYFRGGVVSPPPYVSTYIVFPEGYVCIQELNRTVIANSECLAIAKKAQKNEYLIGYQTELISRRVEWFKAKIMQIVKEI